LGLNSHSKNLQKKKLIKIKTISSLKKEEPPNNIDSYIIPEDWEGCFVHKNTNFQYHKIDEMHPNLAGWCMTSCLTRLPSKQPRKSLCILCGFSEPVGSLNIGTLMWA
jgi:hypothetical protein